MQVAADLRFVSSGMSAGLGRVIAAPRVSWVPVGPGVPACAGSLGKGDVPCPQAPGPARRHREQELLRSVGRSRKGLRCLRMSTLRLQFCFYYLGVLICPVYHFKLSDYVYLFMVIDALGLSYYASYATLD